MANEIFLNNNEKFHVFSKSPITPSMGLAQAVNKSGHTTTTSDVWSQDIPWFFSADSQAIALTTGKDAKLNDLVLIGSNVFKRNATTYSDAVAFTDLWESLTLEDGTELYNSDEKHVLTYHKGVSVTFLTTTNNAKQASNYAGRVFKSDGSVIEQFVASTDKVSSGVPSTGYGVAVYKNGESLSEGELESNFITNSYAGIIQFNAKVGPSTAYTADVFEYVGEKLNTTITQNIAAINEVDAKLTPITEIISDVQSTADEAKETAGAAVQSITDLKNSTISATSTGSDNVSVTLGGTVSAPTLAVTGTDIASAQALTELKQTVTDHITNAGGKLEISVPEGGTLPTTGETGKIYLIPNNGEEEQNIYDEFIWTNNAWEKIGTTKVDLTDYVTNSSLTTTLTGYVTAADKSVLESQISAAQTTANEAKTAAQNAQTSADSKVAQSEYDTKIGELEEAINNAKPENYISTVSDGKTDAEGNYVNETSGETKLVIKDGRTTVYPNDLWGTTVSMVGDTITVQGGPIDGTAWAAKNGHNTITKVENNIVYNETTEVANIKTNELVNGSEMFFNTSLESFSGDLSSLVNGSSMFAATSLTSFSGDLSSLVNGSSMFAATSLTSFSGDLSSLVDGSNMFNNTSLTSFNGDLSSLVNGSSMFTFTQLTSFSGDLSSLVDGSNMFNNASLTSFTGDLSSLVSGEDMFFNTSLDIESVELICGVLPNYNTKNGGTQLQTATWNTSEGKYTYSDWESGNYHYPIIKIEDVSDAMSQGNADGIKRVFGTESIDESDVKTITIKWKSGSAILGEGHEADRTAIAELFTNTAKEKGWTFLVNTEIAESGEIAPPNAVMATDGTIQYYVLAKKDEATEDNATHIDASGKLWKFDTAEAIIGPNIKYWSIFATVEDAITEWELTPIVK